MSQISKKITLSQGHKFVERLSQHINEQNSELRNLVQPVVVSFKDQVAKVEERSAAVAQKIAYIGELNRSLLTLRSEIGKANSATGIHSLLAEQAVIKRQISALETVDHVLKNSQAIDAANLDEAFQRLERKDELPRVQVKVVTDDQHSKILAELTELEHKAMEISDEIHRINGKTDFELVLPQAVAEQIGLRG